ncbi:KTSC domain-containing protein [Duganella violaceipulchra]|uniref:KTSC domain-containing protein n=1 Tax=Duganella violaceipulchra TaxID=2849652 RepID=A0AA41HC78_9BURK|nr:KTSC domain-containing protein [Duganella violaceicalia]MBV6321964.1 KTSC domain-containing protein [Duganella violaceicalia]MCP2007040.1 hypothetical protein [Duganella violaceicalia]
MSATPSITMQPVNSSQFAAYGHSPELNLLAIQFHPKKTGVVDTYHYQNVDAAMFAEFQAAESAGSFFIQRIKKFPDLFPFVKLDAAALAAPVAAAPTHRPYRDQLAASLSGREYPFGLTKDEQGQAKAAGLLVIFGASDDLMEFRGATNSEFDCYGGGTALIDAKGVLPERENIEEDAELKDYFAREPATRKVEAMWAAEPGYSWTYHTDVPHATFEIIEDGTPYCRGIVIDVADLAPVAP